MLRRTRSRGRAAEREGKFMEERAQSLFSLEDRVAPLGIIALEGAEELGEKIDAHLVRWAKAAGMDVDSFMLSCSCPRFGSGDAKGLIEQTVRGYDLYIVVDVGDRKSVV